jgi:hypothetical protein
MPKRALFRKLSNVLFGVLQEIPDKAILYIKLLRGLSATFVLHIDIYAPAHLLFINNYTLCRKQNNSAKSSSNKPDTTPKREPKIAFNY